MKNLFVTILILVSLCAYSQKSEKIHGKKLSKSESTKLTREQRLVREMGRKKKKERISTKKKVKLEKKQDKKARKIKSSGRGKKSNFLSESI